jgi:hypothetical protein
MKAKFQWLVFASLLAACGEDSFVTPNEEANVMAEPPAQISAQRKAFPDVIAEVPVKVVDTIDRPTAAIIQGNHATADALQDAVVRAAGMEQVSFPNPRPDNDPADTRIVKGDFDGDGYTDRAVMVASRSPWTGNSIRITRGSKNGFLPWTYLKGAERQTGRYERFGDALVVAEFNGDGRSDLAVGAPLADPTKDVPAGSVYIYLGSKEGLVLAAWVDPGKLRGEPAMDTFGASLVTDDFNKDGQDDLLVDVQTSGHAFVYCGSDKGVALCDLDLF